MATETAEVSVQEQYASPPVTIILTVIFLVFFFVGFFSIYFCRCFLENLLYSWYMRRPPNATVGPACPNESQGIEQSIIESFPTFTYASVKDLRKEKYGLECAICLCEFADEDALRLLTKCCHVFHQECIDLWLESHKTCPVCRRDLDVGPDKSPTPSNIGGINENEALEDRSHTITIADDNEDRAAAGPATARPAEGQDEEKDKVEAAFGRSKSTGHSIVRSGSNHEDRFTLRLPEHLHAKLIRGHNWTGSCTTFGEFKSKISTGHGGFGEVSDFSGGEVKKE